MKKSVFLDIGMGTFVFFEVYALGLWFAPLQAFGATEIGRVFQGILSCLVVFMVPSLCYVLWHMVRNRHPYWVMSLFLFAPITMPLYYYCIFRGLGVMQPNKSLNTDAPKDGAHVS